MVETYIMCKNGNKHGAANVYHKETFRITKIVQVSAMKVHFQIAERSLFYLNPDIHYRRMTYPSERVMMKLLQKIKTDHFRNVPK